MVQTIAGGVRGNAEGYATNAQFNYPVAVAIADDVNGDQMILVSDKLNGILSMLSQLAETHWYVRLP